MAGIYIHIPFCKQACYYCDFHFSTSLSKKKDLIQALVKELQLRKNELINDTVNTIYFGGGTPSLLTVDEISLILTAIYRDFRVSDHPEITLEANPDDLSKKQIRKLANTPINRLSIGIQSFFDEDLKAMNRAHNSAEAKSCLAAATQYFDNITIDLIYGIPNLSNERWKENLYLTFDFGINHISSYALTVEPRTALANFIKKGTYPPVSEELAAQHFKTLVEETEKANFIHYEISNFGKEGYFSKHNTAYWQGEKYLGIGPSAHSFNGVERSWNIANNNKYIKSIAQNELPIEVELLSDKDRFNEYIMTGLRTISGISLLKVEHDFGSYAKEKLVLNASKFIENKLLIITDETESAVLKVTKKGKFLVDGIASDLFMI